MYVPGYTHTQRERERGREREREQERERESKRDREREREREQEREREKGLYLYLPVNDNALLLNWMMPSELSFLSMIIVFVASAPIPGGISSCIPPIIV